MVGVWQHLWKQRDMENTQQTQNNNKHAQSQESTRHIQLNGFTITSWVKYV